jgi:hypothetical protein
MAGKGHAPQDGGGVLDISFSIGGGESAQETAN